jgi:putative nucleotidyltransferase with HDIG domain
LAQNDIALRPPAQLAELISRLDAFFSDEGIEALVAGGFVRDVLLRRPARDIDVSIKADPLEVAPRLAEALAARYFPLDRERRHARVMLRDADVVVDLLPLRGSAEEDLLLRDYTIDAMGVRLPDIAAGKASLIDPTGGARDLEAGVVRLVSVQALADDPLRMLRGVRLAAQLGFEIEMETARQIGERSASIGEAAVDRQREELLLMLATDRTALALRQMDALGLLSATLPELDAARGVAQPKQHHWDVFGHLLGAVAALDWMLADGPPAGREEPWGVLWETLAWWGERWSRWNEELSPGVSRKATVKLCALLHDIGKPETSTVEPSGRIRFYGHSEAGAAIAARLLRRMHFPARVVNHVSTMIDAHMRPVQIAVGRAPSRRAIYRFFRDTGEAGIDTVILSLADHVATMGPRFTVDGWRRHVGVVNYLLKQHMEGQGASAPPRLFRLLDGDDIMRELGLEPGTQVGELLALVSEAHAVGEVSSREEALELARRHLERSGTNP